MKEYFAFMKKYLPDVDPCRRHATSTAMVGAQLTAQVLKQCGDNLTRENVMKQAASLKKVPMSCCCPA